METLEEPHPEKNLNTFKEILGRSKLTKGDKENLKEWTTYLFSFKEGFQILQDLVTPKKNYIPKKALCEAVISLIESGTVPKTGETEEVRRIVDLLRPIAKGQRVNVPAKWRAIQLLHKLEPELAVELMRISLEVFQPKKEITDLYRKYAKNSLGPDAGLEMLNSLRNKGFARDWLLSLINSVQRDVEVRQRRFGPAVKSDSLTENAVGGIRTGSISDRAGSLTSEGIGAENRVETFLKILETAAQEFRHLLNESIEVSRRLDIVRDRLAKSTKQEEVLEKTNTELRGQIESLEASNQQLQRKQTELETELEKTRIRAQQDIALARGEREDAIQSFRYELWGRLRASFLDVAELESNFDGRPKSERILIKRLLDLLQTLREMEVACD